MHHIPVPVLVGSGGTVNVNGLSHSSGTKGSLARRSGNVSLPHSVATHMSQCAKEVSLILKDTVERIAVDILENGSGSKIDAAAAQQEKDLLLMKHSKEMNDLRHSHGMPIVHGL
jgi:hypothetical protein